MIQQIGGSNTILEEDDFRNQLQTENQVCVLDFSASWCGPCKLMYPYLEQIQNVFTSQDVHIPFYKVDVSEPDNEFCDEFSINSLPTLVFMKNGQELFRTEGFTRDGSKLVEAFAQCQDAVDCPVRLATLVQSVFLPSDTIELSA